MPVDRLEMGRSAYSVSLAFRPAPRDDHRSTPRLTDPSDQLSLDHVLLLKPSLYQLSFQSGIRRPPNPVPHMSTGKDQDGHQTRSLPQRLGLSQGDDVGRGKVQADDPTDEGRRDQDVGDGVEGDVDGERVGGLVGHEFVQLFHSEAAARRYTDTSVSVDMEGGL